MEEFDSPDAAIAGLQTPADTPAELPIDVIPVNQQQFEQLLWTTVSVRGKTFRFDTLKLATTFDELLEDYPNSVEWPAGICEWAKSSPLEIPDLTWGEALFLFNAITNRSIALKKTLPQLDDSPDSIPA